MKRRLAPAAFALFSLTCSTGPVPSYAGGALPDAPATFIVYGDTQRTLKAEFWRKQYDDERLLVSRAIVSEAPDFIVNCGDLVAYGADAGHWARFHAENEAIWSRRVPYFPAVGNHEYYGDNARALANFHAFFPYLKGRTWYDVRAGKALILVLNSNFEELGAKQIADQDAWLQASLVSADADAAIRHVLLCFHHPPYTNAKLLGDSVEAQSHFVSRITPKVKVVASGHVHSYERFLRGGVHFVVSGGGGGPTADLDVEKPRHPDCFKGPAARGFNYLRFRLEGDRLLCDVLMLQPDRTFRRVDGFECP